jgi:hypothetical protein
MKKKTIIKILITSLLLMIAGTGYAMSRFNLCLFSEVEGIVLDHGKPVVGAELERIWDLGYDESTGSDRTTTDEKGYFRFPKVTRFYILPGILPLMQPDVGQDIFVFYQGKKIDAWSTTKKDYKINSELDKPIKLICNVEREPVYIKVPNKINRTIYGICDFVDSL